MTSADRQKAANSFYWGHMTSQTNFSEKGSFIKHIYIYLQFISCSFSSYFKAPLASVLVMKLCNLLLYFNFCFGIIYIAGDLWFLALFANIQNFFYASRWANVYMGGLVLQLLALTFVHFTSIILHCLSSHCVPRCIYSVFW